MDRSNELVPSFGSIEQRTHFQAQCADGTVKQYRSELAIFHHRLRTEP